jgi:uncharacterized Zn-binding protein involved in type VI secretion
MGKPTAVVGSKGHGTCHICSGERDGYIITGCAKTSLDNGKKTAFISSLVEATCGHIGVITTGSATVMVESKKKAFLGSLFDGDYEGVIIDLCIDKAPIGG